MISTSSSLLPFGSTSILGNKKSHMLQGKENMEVAAVVGFCVWLRNVAQAETTVLMHCCGAFSNPLLITFLVPLRILQCRYAPQLEIILFTHCLTL
jgi:hypothetical protein